jgi:hypothetical protein
MLTGLASRGVTKSHAMLTGLASRGVTKLSTTLTGEKVKEIAISVSALANQAPSAFDAWVANGIDSVVTTLTDRTFLLGTGAITVTNFPQFISLVIRTARSLISMLPSSKWQQLIERWSSVSREGIDFVGDAFTKAITPTGVVIVVMIILAYCARKRDKTLFAFVGDLSRMAVSKPYRMFDETMVQVTPHIEDAVVGAPNALLSSLGAIDPTTVVPPAPFPVPPAPARRASSVNSKPRLLVRASAATPPAQAATPAAASLAKERRVRASSVNSKSRLLRGSGGKTRRRTSRNHRRHTRRRR